MGVEDLTVGIQLMRERPPQAPLFNAQPEERLTKECNPLNSSTNLGSSVRVFALQAILTAAGLSTVSGLPFDAEVQQYPSGSSKLPLSEAGDKPQEFPFISQAEQGVLDKGVEQRLDLTRTSRLLEQANEFLSTKNRLLAASTCLLEAITAATSLDTSRIILVRDRIYETSDDVLRALQATRTGENRCYTDKTAIDGYTLAITSSLERFSRLAGQNQPRAA